MECGTRSAECGIEASSDSKRLQTFFDLRSARFEKWRQRQAFTHRFDWLISGESWPFSGQLEQNTVWLSKIKTPEIEAINFSTVRDAELVEPISPSIILIVRNPKRDVMDAACPSLADRKFRAQPNMQLRAGTALTHLVNVDHAISGFLELADRSHAE